ncbi:PhzF family phenazine biosynthesis isomerase [Micromonospora deserti]|uniref:PhzF family phenazine biosynthesis isomerase n=1 Tax=Micromonospora deserti TaxID=2070366 RepID=UPI001F1D9A64|nr:PhzF family phenazine biosynthesis isomerase [Micromonospora deserti]
MAGVTTETHTEVLRYSAFSAHPEGGNPAGVVLDASTLNEVRMRAVAAEVGYSETAFVTAGDAGQRRFSLRYFSPLAEVAFCGHATVATAVALAERGGPGELVFDTAVGEVPVVTVRDADGLIQAALISVATHSRPAEDAELDAALTALNWRRTDLDTALPPHVAFAGNHHLVLAAGSRHRLADLAYDFDALAGVMQRYGYTTVHLVWRQSPNTFHARDPFPIGGIVEDPATGAAAAAFGGYLRQLGLVSEATSIVIHQGVDMGRPSELLVGIDPVDPRVRVTGHAVRIVA